MSGFDVEIVPGWIAEFRRCPGCGVRGSWVLKSVHNPIRPGMPISHYYRCSQCGEWMHRMKAKEKA